MRPMLKSARPSPAMVVGIVALVLALSGSAIGATKLLGLGAFKDGVKNKTVGVGKLTYVTTTTTDNNTSNTAKVVSANCPSGFKVIGGGIKGSDPQLDFIFDSYPTTTGWTGRVFGNSVTDSTFTTTAICAKSRAVTGTPPTS